ncbi:transposable element Tc3 transposase [Trichonephila clavipes]|nr:transposable element Tc3 transposase [Trichonephila clavipes]
MMFSDESRFSFQSDSRRTLILRAPGTRYLQQNTIERHRYGGAEWLVWGGIILGSRTDLHFQSVTMTAHIYRDVILEQHVRSFRGAMCAEFLFINDNSRPHRANIVEECRQSEDITRMDWPAYSPDLNPIEHVWDMFGRRITARQPPLTCLPELRRALIDEWCNIPQDQYDSLILSMPRLPVEVNVRKNLEVSCFVSCDENLTMPTDCVSLQAEKEPAEGVKNRRSRGRSQRSCHLSYLPGEIGNGNYIDLMGASEMNRLYPNSRRESIKEDKYLNTLPLRGGGWRKKRPNENETKNLDQEMDGDCKAKLAAGTVGFEAGVSLFTDPNSDVDKCI